MNPHGLSAGAQRRPDIGYVIDDPREADRLAAKVDSDAWAATYLAPHLTAGDRVLEVGCGPGHLLAAATRTVNDLTAVGVDTHPRWADGGMAGVDLHVGDACRLPFPDGHFDVVYCRFTLEYLPDPVRAVREMTRVCVPGATVLLQDLDGQLVTHYPPDPELDQELAAVLAGLGARLDPFVGRKLYSYARAANLHAVTVAIERYHLIAGTPETCTLQAWDLKLDIAHAAAAAVIGDPAATRLRERFLAYLSRPDTVTYSLQFTVTGRRSDTPRPPS